MVYTLRVPFKVASNPTFSPGVGSVDGRTAQLEASDRWHVLTVRQLKDPGTAQHLLERLAGALIWVALETNVGIKVDATLQQMLELDEPASDASVIRGATAVADEGRAVVYRSDHRVAIVEAMPATVRTSVGTERFYERLADGMELPVNRILSDDRIRLATELLMTSYFEGSVYAAFLARITVLEVLSDRRPHPDVVTDLIDEWKADMRDRSRQNELDADRMASLLGSVERLKSESIGFGIRRLVSRTLGVGAARTAVRLYSVRSDLLHEGSIEGDEIMHSLADLTPLVHDVISFLLSGQRFEGA